MTRKNGRTSSNPSVVQIHQQDLRYEMLLNQQSERVNSQIKLIKDLCEFQINSIARYQAFVDSFFEKLEEAGMFEFDDGMEGSDEMKNSVELLESYFDGLGIEAKTSSKKGSNKLFNYRGIFDRWIVEKTNTINSDFEKKLQRILDQNIEE